MAIPLGYRRSHSNIWGEFDSGNKGKSEVMVMVTTMAMEVSVRSLYHSGVWEPTLYSYHY